MRDKAVEALTVIIEDLVGNPPSSTGISAPTFDTDNEDEWLSSKDAKSETIRKDDPTKTKRPLAYLLAYLAISGGRIPTAGIEFEDGTFVYLDKGVMKSLLIEDRSGKTGQNLVIRKDEFFELTDLGRKELIDLIRNKGG